ncbi:hypothetical protein NDU88_002540 [Pleurodeles waltl]|uniref:Uncharacterized protein n=1 Tax=Pleurodeles waltl TaxID=8319 RepID=A0AAV7MNQ5_PLEWA|nr:hypothetical protein NDU88_002540 [Pleurodeles waltl]
MAILVRKSLPLEGIKIWRDPMGRYEAVLDRWEGELLALISVYVPLALQTGTLQAISKALTEIPQALTIMEGYFDMLMDPTRDTTYMKHVRVQHEGKLSEFTRAMGMVEIWIVLHLRKVAYTHC